MDSSKHHPSSSVHRSNLATWPSALARHLHDLWINFLWKLSVIVIITWIASGWAWRNHAIVEDLIVQGVSELKGKWWRGTAIWERQDELTANLVDGSHRLASRSRRWSWNRTTFWTFCCLQSIRMELACLAHRSIWHLHMQLEFHVGRPPHASISFERIAHRNCDWFTDEKRNFY